MLTSMQLLQLCSFSLLMAGGQILFKMAALHGKPLSSLHNILALGANPWFWGALILYAISTLIWISVLQQIELSTAYPFVALGFIVIPFFSYLLFKEPVNWQYGLGVVLILIALKLITGSR